MGKLGTSGSPALIEPDYDDGARKKRRVGDHDSAALLLLSLREDAASPLKRDPHYHCKTLASRKRRLSNEDVFAPLITDDEMEAESRIFVAATWSDLRTSSTQRHPPIDLALRLPGLLPTASISLTSSPVGKPLAAPPMLRMPLKVHSLQLKPLTKHL